jgi:hypothetical protein
MSSYLADRGVDRAPNGDFRPNIPPAVEQATIRKLRADNILLSERVDELKETVRQLREIMRPKLSFTSEWSLTKQQAALLAGVYSRPVATNDQCIEALGRNDFHDQLGNDKLNHMKVVMHNLRRKLEPFDIRIRTLHRQGYSMDSENKARVRAGIISTGLVEN